MLRSFSPPVHEINTIAGCGLSVLQEMEFCNGDSVPTEVSTAGLLFAVERQLLDDFESGNVRFVALSSLTQLLVVLSLSTFYLNIFRE